MLNLGFSKIDLKKHFSPETLKQARYWVRHNRVKSVRTNSDKKTFSAFVQCADVLPCGVQILAASATQIKGLCSCCLDDSHCQHTAAVLLEILQKSVEPLVLEAISANESGTQGATLLTADNDNDWYGELESMTPDWFNMELGILVKGKPINLLPLVAHFIKSQQAKHKTAVIDPKKDYRLVLDRNHTIIIPARRLQLILKALTELFDESKQRKSHEFLVSNLRAAQLMGFKKKLKIGQWRWYGPEHWYKLADQLRDFSGIAPVVLSAGFNTTLRPYQQHGLDWLQFLRQYSLGGILADDMGLGKTVQVLAHLWCEKMAGRLKKPTLIVAPTSLMTNWRMEVNRFTPKLKVLVCHGQQRAHDFANFDIVITTYTLVVRDHSELIKWHFYYLILDEAQMIKNPRAKVTRCVQTLSAQHRLCLTGTPMENHLLELWSQFNFLLPGFLGTQKQFRKLYQLPIEQANNQERYKSLSERIAPFMLRRTKLAVIKELPEKTEVIQTVTLLEEQRDLYESVRLSLTEKIKSAINHMGLAKSRIIVLDALLKLRQICCDPRLLKLSMASGIQCSAKLDLLMQMLPSLLDEGRSVLVFSAFAQMLALIEQEVIKHDLDYVKLVGTTQAREKPIAQFQAGKVKLFLISLKAGGIGLNLTAADTVIHYDPWWNPAAEMQATDRAYRIGQDKPVFVYKLISENTVEEKILQLQAKKRDLMEGLFSPKTTSKANFKLEDLDFLF